MVEVTRNRVEFSFYRPAARQVYLAGEFNGWRPNQLAMERSSEGYWRVSLDLSPGVYQFRYCADEQWFCDFAAFGIECGPFGPNGVVRVTSHLPGGSAAAQGCGLVQPPQVKTKENRHAGGVQTT